MNTNYANFDCLKAAINFTIYANPPLKYSAPSFLFVLGMLTREAPPISIYLFNCMRQLCWRF